MRKKLLFFILLTVVGVISSYADEWTDSNGVTWTYSVMTYNDMTGAVIRGVANCPAEVVVPATVGNADTPVKWIAHPGGNYSGYQPFRNKTTITKVTIPDGVQIGGGAFENSSNLKEINLSACTSIGASAFSGCSSLTSVGNLSACTSIGESAFSGCSSLASVGNLSACTSIGGSAFSGCTSLSCVGDLSACASIGYMAFYQCPSLISVGNLSACTSIGYEAFSRCTSLSSIGELPACTSIGESAFSGCSSLASVGDLSACTSVGERAFYYCSSLTYIGDLPACTGIGKEAFQYCSSLNSIGNLSSCTSIGSNAFCQCFSLISVGNLSACTSIGDRAFESCLITSLSIGENTQLNGLPQYAFPIFTTILVPEESLETYKSAPKWSDIKSRIIPNNAQTEWDVTVTETPAEGSAIHNLIGEANLASVMSLKIVGDINSYDIFTMRNMMPNLHFLDLSDANIIDCDYTYYSGYRTSNNKLGSYVFYNMYNLLDVKLPQNITSVGSYSFRGTSLKTIEIPEGVTSINEQAFYSVRLKQVKLPSTLTSIGFYAFAHNDLEEIDLPDNLETIYQSAFEGNSNLKELKLPSSLADIAYRAFYGCSKLRTVKAKAIDPNRVIMSDESFSEYANATLYIPYDEETGWETTREAYKWNTQWGQFGNKAYWKPDYDNVNVGGDYNQNKGTIPGVNIGANFGNNAGYHLGQYAKQGFDKMKIKHNGKDGASIIDDDDNLTANELTCDITVTANKWYFFCFPFDVNISQIQAPGESVWRKYNAAVRASNGNGGWQKLGSDDKKLKAGQGYIFQCNTAGTLVITVDNPDFNADNKSAQLEEYVAGNAQDASWNFVGNPFLSYYELADLGHDAPVTIWNGSGYEAVRPGDDDYALQPFQAFFVQKTAGSDEVTVDKDKRETKQQSEKKVKAAKARRAKQAINPDRLLINLEMTDGETIDKTRVVFNDRQQMDYEPECDAAKFMSTEQVPQLYTYYNNVNYAINERPNRDTEVRLAFKAPKAGEYTISATRMDTPMLLKDTELGITFDFQTGSYTFESKAGTNDKRFILVKNNTETAIQPVTIGDAESAEFFNLAGQKTSANAKGVVISNGKKLLKK